MLGGFDVCLTVTFHAGFCQISCFFSVFNARNYGCGFGGLECWLLSALVKYCCFRLTVLYRRLRQIYFVSR